MSISWSLLETLKYHCEMLWVVFGDFKEITHPDEKLGWADRVADQTRSFRDYLGACGLHDIGFVGKIFTWCNGQFGDQRTLIQLDYVVANKGWLARFFKAQVHHISMAASDHCLLALFLRKKAPPKRKVRKRFLFEAMWTRDDRCKEVIEGAWDPLRVEVDIQERVKNCQGQLQRWNHEVSGIVTKVPKLKQDQLRQLEALNLLHETTEEIQGLKKEINETLIKEKLIWNQRSKAFWIKCGDRNTKFFHVMANQIRRINKIEGFRGADDVWYDQPEDIEREFLEYFSSIFSTASPSSFAASLEAKTRGSRQI